MGYAIIINFQFSYVLRRILRRGVRYCTEKLNAQPGVFAALVPTVVDILVRLIAHICDCGYRISHSANNLLNLFNFKCSLLNRFVQESNLI